MLKKLVLAGLIAFAAGTQGIAQEQEPKSQEEAVAAISQHFASVPTMTGEFIQFGPTGEQTGGIFYIQRPGKIRFVYENPSPLTVVSNGRTVGVNNRKLDTWSFYPLDKTPLKLLLDDHIAFSDDSIRSVNVDEQITTVVMGNEQIFGNSEITLLFDPQTSDLRQWTIKDAQGKETSVMIFNVEKNVKISRKHFVIDKQGILEKRNDRSTR